MKTTSRVYAKGAKLYMEIIHTVCLDDITLTTQSAPLDLRDAVPDRFQFANGAVVKTQQTAMIAGIARLLHKYGFQRTSEILNGAVIFGRNIPTLITPEERVALSEDAKSRYNKFVLDKEGNQYYVYAQFGWWLSHHEAVKRDGATRNLLRIFMEHDIEIKPLYDEVEA